MNSQWLSMEFVGGISPLPAHSFSFSMNSPLVFSRIGGRRWGRRKKRTSPRRGETCQSTNKRRGAERPPLPASAWAQTEPSRGPGCAQQARLTSGPPHQPQTAAVPGFGSMGKDFISWPQCLWNTPVLTPPPTCWHSEQADVSQLFSQHLMGA